MLRWGAVMSSDSSMRQIWLVSIVLAIIFGGAAGWLTSSATLLPDLQRVQDLVSQVTRPNNTQPTSTSTQVEIIPVQPADAGYETLPESLSSGRATPTLSVFRADQKNAEALTFAQDQFAVAVALTADGWLVVPSSALPASTRLADLSIGWQHRLYTPTKGVRDLATGITFLKIDAQNLPVAGLVSRVDVDLTQTVWREAVPNQYAQSAVLRIGQISPSATSLSSDQWNRRFLLTDAASGSASAVWDTRGRLIGISETSSTKAVIPADVIRSGLSSLLATGDIRRPTLGVRYIDLSDSYLSSSAKALPEKGAWLQAEKKGSSPAVASTSAAAKVLREGDVIERIDNDVLDGRWSLAEHVLEYRPGSQVTVSGIRDAKPFQAQVTFGSAVTSELLK